METDDRYVRITLRIPRELHASLTKEAAEKSHSMNAEIVSRLEGSFATRTLMKPDLVSGHDIDVSLELEKWVSESGFAQPLAVTDFKRVIRLLKAMRHTANQLHPSVLDTPNKPAPKSATWVASNWEDWAKRNALFPMNAHHLVPGQNRLVMTLPEASSEADRVAPTNEPVVVASTKPPSSSTAHGPRPKPETRPGPMASAPVNPLSRPLRPKPIVPQPKPDHSAVTDEHTGPASTKPAKPLLRRRPLTKPPKSDP